MRLCDRSNAAYELAQDNEVENKARAASRPTVARRSKRVNVWTVGCVRQVVVVCVEHLSQLASCPGWAQLQSTSAVANNVDGCLSSKSLQSVHAVNCVTEAHSGLGMDGLVRWIPLARVMQEPSGWSIL